MPKLLFRGRVCHSLSASQLEIIPDALLGVSDGVIAFLYEFAHLENQDLELFLRHEGYADAEFIQLNKDQFLFPGLIDTHIHAPQYPNAGFGMDVPLMEWLEKYTFPTESSMSDPARAQGVYSRIVEQTLRQGTTFACYYSSIHIEATNILANLCLQAGQRAFIGKCNMDMLSPDHYRETCASSIESTKACISHVRSLDPTGNQLTYCITPRFAPSCSDELLTALGELAASENLPIQTHISENVSELALVRERFPRLASYTAVYDSFRLLTPRTILAHAIYLSPAELALIRERGTGVSHCPASNTALASGECPVREILDLDIPLGLGTDVSGGYTASILDSAKLACSVSRHRQIHASSLPSSGALPSNGVEAAETRTDVRIGVVEALYMATLGGARVCSVADKLGNFERGKELDALLIDLSPARRGRVDLFPGESDGKVIEKWVFNGDDRNIARIYIAGKVVLENRIG